MFFDYFRFVSGADDEETFLAEFPFGFPFVAVPLCKGEDFSRAYFSAAIFHPPGDELRESNYFGAFLWARESGELCRYSVECYDPKPEATKDVCLAPSRLQLDYENVFTFRF